MIKIPYSMPFSCGSRRIALMSSSDWSERPRPSDGDLEKIWMKGYERGYAMAMQHTMAMHLNHTSVFTQTMVYKDNTIAKMQNAEVQTNTDEIDECYNRIHKPWKQKSRSLAWYATKDVKIVQERIATMVREQAARVKNE